MFLRDHGWRTARVINRARILLKTDEGWSASQVAAALDAPEGHDHWTLRLLADKVVDLGLVASLSHETTWATCPQGAEESEVLFAERYERRVLGHHVKPSSPKFLKR